MPDYTIGVAERIASLPDSTATSNSVNRNYFQETSQSVVNVVNVAIAPAAPTALDPTPTTTYATATDETSVDTFGTQETPIVITLLATIEDAGALAEYLIRAVPAYWFSNLAISLNTLSDANKNIVANLEIGQQIAVTKTFPAGVVPQTVTEYLFVEGISHSITVESHVVTIYTGPASTYLQWVLGNYTTTSTRTNLITNPSFETNTTPYSAINGATIVRTTSEFYSGTASLQVTNSASTSTGFSGYSAATLSVSEGLSYTLSYYVKAQTATIPSMYCFIVWLNSGGSEISRNNSAQITATTTWQRVSVTANAPVGAVSAALRFARASAATAGTIWFADGILFEQASSALPYFDGTYDDAYTGYTLTFQAWNGTADTSTSTTVWGLNSSGTGSALGDTTYGLA
jgi:hypothetical protein